MNFAFSEEQEELRRTVRQFLEAKSPETEVRGLQGLAIPEEYGGQGFTFIELGIVLEEMGRVLLCAPYFASAVLAANAILNAGTDDQKQALLPGIASGDTIATLAFTEPSGKWDPAGITMEAKEGEAGRFTLSGEKMFVIDGFTADLIVVVARTAGTSGTDGISFFTVRGDADGLTRTSLSTMDMTRKQAKLEFNNVAAEPLGSTVDGFAAFSKTLDQAAVALSNEMMGGAQKVLEMSVDSGKSAASYASSAAAEDNNEPPVVAALSKAYCSFSNDPATTENIQIH